MDKAKQFVKEAGFFIGVSVAIILTIADILFGVARYIAGLLRGKGNFNPWKDTFVVWRPIWLHLKYLANLFRPSFRESIRRNREAMHQRALAVREAFRRTGDIHVFDDFDYVEGIDVATFFLILPYGIIWGVMLVQFVVSSFFVIAGYGVYKHYQTTPLQRKTPEQHAIVKYQPQVADEQEADFGPEWLNRSDVLDKVNDPAFKNVALLSDGGSIKYSTTKTVEPTGFNPLAFDQHVVNPSQTRNGQMRFQDQNNEEFTLNKEQAFMIEGYNSKMFMFNNHGELLGIDPKIAKKR